MFVRATYTEKSTHLVQLGTRIEALASKPTTTRLEFVVKTRGHHAMRALMLFAFIAPAVSLGGLTVGGLTARPRSAMRVGVQGLRLAEPGEEALLQPPSRPRAHHLNGREPPLGLAFIRAQPAVGERMTEAERRRAEPVHELKRARKNPFVRDEEGNLIDERKQRPR